MAHHPTTGKGLAALLIPNISPLSSQQLPVSVLWLRLGIPCLFLSMTVSLCAFLMRCVLCSDSDWDWDAESGFSTDSESSAMDFSLTEVFCACRRPGHAARVVPAPLDTAAAAGAGGASGASPGVGAQLSSNNNGSNRNRLGLQLNLDPSVSPRPPLGLRLPSPQPASPQPVSPAPSVGSAGRSSPVFDAYKPPSARAGAGNAVGPAAAATAAIDSKNNAEREIRRPESPISQDSTATAAQPTSPLSSARTATGTGRQRRMSNGSVHSEDLSARGVGGGGGGGGGDGGGVAVLKVSLHGPPAVDASTSLLSAPKLAARYSSNGHGRRHNDHSATGTFFSLLSSVSSLLFFFRAHFLPALV
jgi:hypothetical protein